MINTRHKSKPSPGVQIDWSHPLAYGLIGFWPLNEGAGKIVNNLAVHPQLGAITGTAWTGNALRHSATTDRTALLADSLVPTTNITVSLGYRKTDTTARLATAAGIDGVTTTGRCNIHLPYSDNVVYWDFGGVTSGVSRITAASLTFGDDAWSFVAGTGGMRIWQNGRQRATQSGTATRTVFGANWTLGTGAGLGSDLADYKWVAMHNVPLDAERIQQLHAEPFALMAPQRRIFISLPQIFSRRSTSNRVGTRTAA